MTNGNTLRYTIFNNPDGTGNATLFHDNQLYTATTEHPRWQAIVAGLVANDSGVVDLFDPSLKVAAKFESLSDRVTVSGGHVYFDGDEVDNALTKQIVRFLNEGVEDWEPLVKFWERLAANPNPHSVEQLYRWLEVQDIVIDPDGMLLGYKGVVKSTDEEGNVTYKSVNTGTAIVDGETVTGAIPNHIGAVVTMPRSAVEFDPSNGCSTGLHVGTWDYARGWARGAVLLVEVDPRDVVSVPTDCNSQKLRVCRYEVIDVIESELTDPLYGDSAYDDYDEDEEDYDSDYDSDDEVDDEDRCTCYSCKTYS